MTRFLLELRGDVKTRESFSFALPNIRMLRPFGSNDTECRRRPPRCPPAGWSVRLLLTRAAWAAVGFAALWLAVTTAESVNAQAPFPTGGPPQQQQFPQGPPPKPGLQQQPQFPVPQQPPAPATGPVPQPAPPQASGIAFRLENADLLQFINLIASQLKLNYIVDPAVKGSVNITTMGNLRSEDLLPILETVLKINGATAIPTGNFYRIVPLAQAPKTPLEISSDVKTLPKDDRMVMQIIPLRFVFAGDMAKMLTPFLSDAGTIAVEDAGNVMILVDDSLNVKRLMDILAQFDSPAFAQQRVHLIPVRNNVASGLVPELESIFSAYALAAKNTPLRFVPLDRINAILVVAADPAAFGEVEKWVEKLDQPAAPSGIQTFVYRVENSEAGYLARLLSSTLGAKSAGPAPERPSGGASARPGLLPTGALGGPSGGPGGNLELGSEAGGSEQVEGGVRIIPDAVNNSLIIQSTPAQYAEILKTLKEIDILPRQVLIEARVYEVTLTGDLSFGLSYFLEQRSNAEKKLLGSFTATGTSTAPAGLQLSAGTLIGRTRELLAFLNASENRSRVQVLSAPSVLATDNSEAKLQVGAEVPILTSQAVVGGVQVGSTSVFTNTVQNRDTGIILTVTPRITSSGLVSLKVSQEISNVQPPATGGIQSPSFSKRSLNTHTLVQDGETIALGGLISYTVTKAINRIPLLGDIPGLGALFGSTTYTKLKTELIVLLSPHIVRNSPGARDATRELQDKLADLRRAFKKDKLVNP